LPQRPPNFGAALFVLSVAWLTSLLAMVGTLGGVSSPALGKLFLLQRSNVPNAIRHVLMNLTVEERETLRSVVSLDGIVCPILHALFFIAWSSWFRHAFGWPRNWQRLIQLLVIYGCLAWAIASGLLLRWPLTATGGVDDVPFAALRFGGGAAVFKWCTLLPIALLLSAGTVFVWAEFSLDWLDEMAAPGGASITVPCNETKKRQ
jgi:hypothetical protein